jgi:predicted metal-binding protein
MSNAIHLYCTAAADRMVAMSETVDSARTINAENVRLTAELERVKQERDALKIDKLNLTSMVEELEKARAERDSMATALKTRGGCDTCKHCDCEWHQEPCDSCRQDDTYPKWKWKGA